MVFIYQYSTCAVKIGIAKTRGWLPSFLAAAHDFPHAAVGLYTRFREEPISEKDTLAPEVSCRHTSTDLQLASPPSQKSHICDYFLFKMSQLIRVPTLQLTT